MLEDFIGPAAAKRLRDWVPAGHAEAFCARLIELGYTHSTIQQKLWIVTTAARWMEAKQSCIAELDELHIEQLRDARRYAARHRRVPAAAGSEPVPESEPG